MNFVQDIEIDLQQKNRCYIPLDELELFNVPLNDVITQVPSPNYTKLIDKQLSRATEIYQQGTALGENLPGFFGLEIKFIIACGQKMLDKLAVRENIFERPLMYKTDMLLILCKVIMNRKSLPQIIDPIMEKL